MLCETSTQCRRTCDGILTSYFLLANVLFFGQCLLFVWLFQSYVQWIYFSDESKSYGAKMQCDAIIVSVQQCTSCILWAFCWSANENYCASISIEAIRRNKTDDLTGMWFIIQCDSVSPNVVSSLTICSRAMNSRIASRFSARLSIGKLMPWHLSL